MKKQNIDAETSQSLRETDVNLLNVNLIRVLYQYKPDIEWIAGYLGVPVDDLNREPYAPIFDASGLNKHEYVEFCLYYLATVKKDIRAILAWLEVYVPDKYGKGEVDEDVGDMKAELLKYLAEKLPG